MSRTSLSIITAMLLLTPAGPAESAKFNRVVDIGDKAPGWKNLIGVDGKKHSLADHKQAKAVVVVFTCNHCPVAKAYEKRLLELVEKNRRKKVQLVAISISQFEADNLEAMKKRASEKKYSFPYLQDTSQKTGKDWGALCTPHVFLLNSKRRIAYMGKIDDSLYEDQVTEHFLQDAIDAVLAGKGPEVEETKPIGCPIDYESP